MSKMKKLIVIIALLLLVSFSVTAYAAGNDWDSLAPYATIDLSVLKEAGWQCTFDEMKFTATMNPADNKIGISVGKDGIALFCKLLWCMLRKLRNALLFREWFLRG